jgi:hypothetical protein
VRDIKAVILKQIDKNPGVDCWHLKRLSEAGKISISYGTEFNAVNNNLIWLQR